MKHFCDWDTCDKKAEFSYRLSYFEKSGERVAWRWSCEFHQDEVESTINCSFFKTWL